MTDPFPGGPDLPEGPELDKLIKQLEMLVPVVEAKVDELAHTVNRALDSLGPVGHQLRELLQGAIETIGASLKELFRLLEHPGAGGAILAAADGWSGAVMGPVSGLGSKKDPSQSSVQQDWTGDAATSYAQVFTPERLALNAVAKAAGDIQGALTAIAVGLATFYGAMAAATVVLLAALVGAIIAAGTGVGLPAAITTVVVAAAAYAGATEGALAAVGAWCDTQYSALEKVADDNMGFIGHGASADATWPTTVNDLSDGSITDNDGTDWHVTAK